jgi:hypothetical protein
MKKLAFIFILVLTCSSSLCYSQTKNDLPSYSAFGNSRPGLLNITEINVGIGLNIINVDYSLQQLNVSSIFGIGLAKNLTGGVGIGYSIYIGGV